MTMQNVFNIRVDLKAERSISKPKITQNDSVVFVLEVMENGVAFDLTDTTTISLAHARRDGTVVVTEGTRVGNIATFELGTNVTAVIGDVTAKAQFYDAAGRVSTLSFSYQVTVDPTGSGYIPSENESTLIEVVLNDGPLIIASAEEAAAYANEQGDYALQVGVDNETRYLNAVETVALRDSTYPLPAHGDTVRITELGRTDRYVLGTGWVTTDVYNPVVIDELSQQLADIAYNVKSYGAKGDGVTNDTTVIQNLINTVSSQGGGSVFFPKGTYISYLQLPSNIRIFGVGYDSCIKLPSGLVNAKPVIINTDNTNGNKNITIENLRIDGNRSNLAANAIKGIGYPWEGIDIILGTDIRVKNVWIENCDNEGLDLDGGTNILVDGLYVTGCGGSPLHPSNGQGAYSSKNVIIRNVWSKNNGHTYSRSVFIYGSNDVVFDGYFSEGDYMGLQILAEKVKASNITIKNPTNRGILISSTSKDIQLTNVFVEGTGDIGIVVNGSDVVLSNIRVKSTFSNGVNIESNHVQVNNCKVESAGGYGYFVNGNDISLSNTKAISSTNRGFNITGQRINLNGIVAKDGITHGLNLNNCADIVLTGSTILGNQGYGITLNGTASNYVITGNNLSNNPSGAIFGSRVGHLIENNTGDINKKYGSVTIPTGTALSTVTHGLGAIPQFVSLMLTPSESSIFKYEVGARTATTFEIKLNPAPTTNVTFLWKVE